MIVLDAERTGRRPATAVTAAPAGGEPQILLDGVAKLFPGRGGDLPVVALQGVSLEVASGEIHGVIGPSGAGKSTLIRLVNGLERPTGGRVVVGGQDVGGLDPAGLRALRRRIGMIFQHFNLLSSRTAYGNVALPLELEGLTRTAIRERVEPLLARVGIYDKRHRYPAELSGGQKQRVAIARALACRPLVLLSDEATSALDPETTRSILRLIAELNAELGLTVLLITHEMQVIKEICHRVAVLDEGGLVEAGPVAEVFASPRAAVTRKLVEAAAFGWTPPPWLARRMVKAPVRGGRVIARVVAQGPSAAEPVLSRLARELGVEAAIVGGQIDQLGGRPFGVLILALPGEENLAARAGAYLRDRGFGYEVLGHVPADA